jgi:hypothetical protein
MHADNADQQHAKHGDPGATANDAVEQAKARLELDARIGSDRGCLDPLAANRALDPQWPDVLSLTDSGSGARRRST